jgi:hypothetical protein
MEITQQPTLTQYMSFFTLSFLTFQALENPHYFKYRITCLLQMFITILHAPLDIIIGYIQEHLRFDDNLKKYRQERKKHLYWDQVPKET